MAIVTRYYGATSAGADDGTTWADRKAFIVAGAINTQISAWDFTTDSLVAMVGPGTHTLTTGIATFTGTTTPTFKIPCIFLACDSSGVQWEPPDPNWLSSQPAWDDTNMPVIATTTNISTINNTAVFLRGFKITASGATTSIMIRDRIGIDWCIVENSSSNASAIAIGTSSTALSDTNVCVTMTGSIYSAAYGTTANVTDNIRVVGNASASSGLRGGIYVSLGAGYTIIRATVFNHVGIGVQHASTSAAGQLRLVNCVIADNDGDAIKVDSTSTGLSVLLEECMVTTNGGYGVNSAGTGSGIVMKSRFRNNTSGDITGLDNWPVTLSNITTAGSDADEYVDASGGDYRIKNTSTYWGKGLGAGDEALAAGGRAGRSVIQALSIPGVSIF